jgi:hypothetical protein
MTAKYKMMDLPQILTDLQSARKSLLELANEAHNLEHLLAELESSAEQLKTQLALLPLIRDAKKAIEHALFDVNHTLKPHKILD